jgi:hypothetical protein
MSCSEVARYSGGSWTTYTVSSGTNDFAINRDQGIMVLAGRSGTWNASSPSGIPGSSAAGQSPAATQPPRTDGRAGYRLQP